MGRCHPDVGVRSVFHARPDSETLQVGREDIEHCSARDESGSSKGNSELVAGTVVVSASLQGTTRDSDTVQRGDSRRCEVIQSSIDVPPVETSDTLVGFLI